MSNYHGGLMVCKKAAEELGEGFAKKPIGTGPFMFVEYQPQQFVKLVANKSYFRGAPQIDEITYRYMPSDATRDLAFQSGELDMMFGRQTDQWVERTRKCPVTVVGRAWSRPSSTCSISTSSRSRSTTSACARPSRMRSTARRMVQFHGDKVSREAVSVVPERQSRRRRGWPLPLRPRQGQGSC